MPESDFCVMLAFCHELVAFIRVLSQHKLKLMVISRMVGTVKWDLNELTIINALNSVCNLSQDLACMILF